MAGRSLAYRLQDNKLLPIKTMDYPETKPGASPESTMIKI